MARRGNKPQINAFDLKAGGEAAINIEDRTFDASAAVRVDNGGQSATIFRRNTMLDNSLVTQSKDLGESRPLFEAVGSSPASKFFQGNRIYRGATEFNSKNWLIGGDSDAESNLLIGIRVKISTAKNADNYSLSLRRQGRAAGRWLCQARCPRRRADRRTGRPAIQRPAAQNIPVSG